MGAVAEAYAELKKAEQAVTNGPDVPARMKAMKGLHRAFSLFVGAVMDPSQQWDANDHAAWKAHKEETGT